MTLEYQTLKGMLTHSDIILTLPNPTESEISELAKRLHAHKESLKTEGKKLPLLSDGNLIAPDFKLIQDNLFTASYEFTDELNITFADDEEKKEFSTLLTTVINTWKTIAATQNEFGKETSEYFGDYPLLNTPALEIITILENLNEAHRLVAIQLNAKPLEAETSTEAAESALSEQQKHEKAEEPLPQTTLPSARKTEDTALTAEAAPSEQRKHEKAEEPLPQTTLPSARKTEDTALTAEATPSAQQKHEKAEEPLPQTTLPSARKTEDESLKVDSAKKPRSKKTNPLLGQIRKAFTNLTTITTTVQPDNVTVDTQSTEKPTTEKKREAEGAITKEIKIQQPTAPTKATAQPGDVTTGEAAPKTTDVTPQKSKVTEATAPQTHAGAQPPISVPVPAQPQQPAKVATAKAAPKTADVTVQKSEVTGTTAPQTQAGAQPPISVPVPAQPQQPGATGTVVQQGAPSDTPSTSDSTKKSDASKKPLPKLLRYLILGFVFVYTLGIYPLVKYLQTKKDREAVKNIDAMAEGAEKTEASNKIPEDYFKRAMFSTGTNFLIKAQVGLGMACDSTRKLIGPTLDGKIATETLRSVPKARK